jgi:hypothetical protein
MSFRTQDEARLLLAFLAYLRRYDDPLAQHDAELVAAFFVEREVNHETDTR